MRFWKQFHLDFGIPALLPEWKAMFSPKYLAADISAGLTVAFIAIPLSLAIALASGVSAAQGLVTAIIAGVVCAFFGGSRLAVSGPAAAMSVLIADMVARYGVSGLILLGLTAGIIQLCFGVFGLGRFARLVPVPVIAGFTAGIGFIILVGQLPRAFGLAPPTDAHFLNVLDHIATYFHEANGACLLVVIVTFVLVRGLPKIFKGLPSILPAVLLATAMVYLFRLDDNVPLIGSIPRSLPTPQWPSLRAMPFSEMLIEGFTIFLLASLETLLSASAIDKLAGGKKHNSDQELIGQGLGNIAVSLFGGIPVTGVIARSATNVQAGAKTRRSSIFHSIVLLLTVMFAAPLIGLIPIPALAGVLFSVALNMINYKEFKTLWVTSRPEALIYGITFLTIIFTDLVAGVQAGMIAAGVIVLLQAAKTHLHISFTSNDGAVRLSVTGALTFLSINKISEIEDRLARMKKRHGVILDLSAITNLDTSGANAIIDLFKYCEHRKIRFYIKGLPKRYESLFRLNGGIDLLDNHYIITENELHKKLKSSGKKSARGRLIHGFYRFYREKKHNDRRLFEFITTKQDPHTLFITCSDSRISPSLITSSEPGELFMVRNVGNFVPPYDTDHLTSEAAAIEFVLMNLDITDIVVCGHANCGAMRACSFHGQIGLPPNLTHWIDLISKQIDLNEKHSINKIARLNVLNQIENLKTYPLVKDKISQNALNLHAWFYDFNKSLIFEWDKKQQNFKSIISEHVIQH